MSAFLRLKRLFLKKQPSIEQTNKAEINMPLENDGKSSVVHPDLDDVVKSAEKQKLDVDEDNNESGGPEEPIIVRKPGDNKKSNKKETTR